MSEKLPAGALIEVRVDIRVPIEATEEEISAWLRFGMLQTGSISGANPLVHESPDEWNHSLDWEWRGKVGRREEYDHQTTENGGRRYKVRHIEEWAQR